MLKLSKKEKKEILEFVNSRDVKKDFRIIQKNQKRDITLDEYIEFLNQFQKFSAVEKEFRKIIGVNFKL